MRQRFCLPVPPELGQETAAWSACAAQMSSLPHSQWHFPVHGTDRGHRLPTRTQDMGQDTGGLERVLLPT